jgi:hypothetical protein
MVRVGGAEERHLADAEGRGDVHQPGVVADHRARAGDERECVEERGLAGEVHASMSRSAGRDLVAQRRFLAGAEEDDRRIEHRRQGRVVLPRPALRRTVLGAGSEHVVAALLQARGPQGFVGCTGWQLQSRHVTVEPLRVAAQCRIEGDHGRPVLGVLEAMREHPDARLAEIADPPGNAGEQGQQRALEGVRQDVRDVEPALQLLADRSPGAKLQAAVLEGKLDDFVHLRHRAVDRCHPRNGADGEPLAARVQAAKERLGHDRVADPLGGDDEGAGHHGVVIPAKAVILFL